LETVGGLGGNSNWTKICLPKATVLTEAAFHHCPNLKFADLPVCTRIDTYVFGETPLETLILRANTVCRITGTNQPLGTLILAGTGYVYVPSALIEDYKVATNWSTYASQLRAIEDYPEICGGEV
jgi:hypothetical protein